MKICRNPKCLETLKYGDDAGGFCPSCRLAYFIGMKTGAAIMTVAGVLWAVGVSWFSR